jgi:hypothetical protein
MTAVADLAANGTLVVQGLRLQSFASSSRGRPGLWLGGAAPAAQATTEWLVGAPTVFLGEQAFLVGDAATELRDLRLAEAIIPGLAIGRQVRFEWPDSLGVRWDSAVESPLLGGAAAARVLPQVQYLDGDRTLVLTIAQPWAGGEELNLGGLRLTGFDHLSAPAAMRVRIDDRVYTQTAAGIRVGRVAADLDGVRVFAKGDASAEIPPLTISETTVPGVTAGRPLRLVLPVGLRATWDRAVTVASLAGSAASHTNAAVAYTANGREAQLQVRSDWTAGDTLVVAGLRLRDFVALSRPAAITLSLTPTAAGLTAHAQTAAALSIGAPRVTMAAQRFVRGDAPTFLTPVTIREQDIACIGPGRLLRLGLPSTLLASWDTSVPQVRLAGSEAGKVATAVTYDEAGQWAALQVLEAFSPGGDLVIDSLAVLGFGGVSRGNLSLSLATTGDTTAVAAQPLQVGVPALAAVNRQFVVGDSAAAVGQIRITDSAVPGIGAGRQLLLQLPAELQAAWDTRVTFAGLGGTQADLVDRQVTYSADGRQAALRVLGNFDPYGALTIDGLRLDHLAAMSAAPVVLQLDGAVDGVAATVAQWRIGAPAFDLPSLPLLVGDGETEVPPVRLVEGAVAGLDSGRVLTFVLPDSLGLQWLLPPAAVAFSGSAVAKVAPAITYDANRRRASLMVTAPFAPNDSLGVHGLRLSVPVQPAPPAPLSLYLSQSGAAERPYRDSRGRVRVGRLRVDLGGSQTVAAYDPPTDLVPLTLAEDPLAAGLTAARRLELLLPGNGEVSWDTTVAAIAVEDSLGSRLADLVAYARNGRAVILQVTADWLAGETATVTGLRLLNQGRSLSPAALAVTALPTGATVTTAARLAVATPSLASQQSQQTFVVSDSVGSWADIVVRNDAAATAITAARGLRLSLPAAGGIRWDPAAMPTVLPAQVGATTHLASGDTALEIVLQRDLEAGDSLVVQGAAVLLHDVTPRDRLRASVNGGATTTAVDSGWFQVGRPHLATTRGTRLDARHGLGLLARATIREDWRAASIVPRASGALVLQLPLGLGWDVPADTDQLNLAALVSGSAAALMDPVGRVSADGRELAIGVRAALEPGDSLVFDGLPLRASRQVALTPLQLSVTPPTARRPLADASDSLGLAVGAPSLAALSTGVRDTLFVDGDPFRVLPEIVITESDTAALSNRWDGLRLVLPDSLNATWRAAAPLDLSASSPGVAAKVRPVAAADYLSPRDLHLTLLEDLAPGDTLRLRGLTVDNPRLSPRGLVKASAGGGGPLTPVLPITVGRPTLAVAADAAFVARTGVVGDTLESLPVVTIREDDRAPSIIPADGLRLSLPPGLGLRWAPPAAMVALRLGGTAAARVGGAAILDADSLQLHLDVLAPWVAGDELSVSGLQVRGFAAVARPDTLALSVTAGYSGNAVANHSLRVGRPVLATLADQRLLTGVPGRPFSLVVREDPAVGCLASQFALVLPAALGAVWDPVLAPDAAAPLAVTVRTSVPGNAVSLQALGSENRAGDRLLFALARPLAAGDSIVVEGLRLTPGLVPTPGLPLLLSVNGGLDAVDDHQIRVSGHPEVVLRPAAGTRGLDTAFVVGDPDTALALVVRDTSSVAAIRAGDTLLVTLAQATRASWRWPPALPASMASWVGLPASVEPVGANPGDLCRGLRLPVLRDLDTGDSLEVALRLGGYAAASPRAGVVVSVLGDTALQQGRTAAQLRIGQPRLHGARDQVFIAGRDGLPGRYYGGRLATQPGAPCVALTVSEDPLVPAITATDGIDLVLPDSLGVGFVATDSLAIAGPGQSRLPLTSGPVPCLTRAAGLEYRDPWSNADGPLLYRRLHLPVTADFAAGDSIQIDGARLGGMARPARRAPIGLSVNGGRSLNAIDSRTIRVGRPQLWTVEPQQRFVLGEDQIPAARLLVAEDPIEAAITQVAGLELRLDGGLGLALTDQVRLGGSASTKVTSTELVDRGRVLRIRLNRDFAAGDAGPDTLIFDGLVFRGQDPLTGDLGPIQRPGASVSLFALSVSDTANVDAGTSQGAAIGSLSFAIDTSCWFRAHDPPSVCPELRFTQAGAASILRAGDTLAVDLPGPAPLAWLGAGDAVTLDEPHRGATQRRLVWDVVAPEAAATTWALPLPRVTPPGAVGEPIFLRRDPAGLGHRVAWVVRDPAAAGTLRIGDVSLGAFTDTATVFPAFSVRLQSADPQPDPRRVDGRFAATASQALRIARPSLTSSRRQSFFVGSDTVGLVPLTVSGTIDSVLAFLIPDSLAAVWDTNRTAVQVVLTGSPPIQSTSHVAYTDSARVAQVHLVRAMEATDTVRVAGLAWRIQTQAGRNAPLALSLNGGRSINARDFQAKRIGDPTFVVRAPTTLPGGLQDTMVFISRQVAALDRRALPLGLPANVAAGPDTSVLYPLRITESPVAAGLLAGDQLQIQIPLPFGARWSGAPGVAVTTRRDGQPTGKVRWEGLNADSTAVLLRVDADLDPGEQIALDGLALRGFWAPSPNTPLHLRLRQECTRVSAQAMRIGAPQVRSAAPPAGVPAEEVYVVGDPPSAKASVVVREDATAASITAARDLLLVLPDTLGLSWDTAYMVWGGPVGGGPLGLVLGGSAVARIDSVRPVALSTLRLTGTQADTIDYDRDFAPLRGTHALRIYVGSSFAPGDSLVLSNLRLRDFRIPSSGHLALWALDVRYPVQDSTSIYLGGPRLVSDSTQVFVAGDQPTPLYPVSIIDDSRVATLRRGRQLRLSLPADLGAIWDTDEGLQAQLTLAGGGADKVAVTGTVAGRELAVPILATFAPGDTLRILDGLRLRDFRVSPPARLGLRVSETDSVHVLDQSTKRVGQPWVRVDNVPAGLESVPLDLTPAVARRFDLTIGEDPIAAALTRRHGVRLTWAGPDSTGLARFLEFDTTGVWVSAGATARLIPGHAARDTLWLALDRDLGPGQALQLRGLGLRVKPTAYDSVTSWARLLPRTDSLALVVHGGIDASLYTYARPSGEAVAVTNPNRGRAVAVAATGVEGFAPLMLAPPCVVTTHEDGAETTWVAFPAVPGLIDTAAWARTDFQVFRDSTGSAPLLTENAGLRPRYRSALYPLHTARPAPPARLLPLWEVQIPLTLAEVRRLNRWFDDSYLGLGTTRPHLLASSSATLLTGAGPRRGPYRDRRDTDAEDSYAAAPRFPFGPAPETVRQPLSTRVQYPPGTVLGGATGPLFSGLSWGAYQRPVRVVVANRAAPRHQLGVAQAAVSERGLSLAMPVVEGANEVRCYFGQPDSSEWSLPVIRQVVVDTTAPRIARLTEGRPYALPPDSVRPPQAVTAPQDTNALLPIAGLDRDGRGLPVNVGDTLRAKVIDNLRLLAAGARDTLAADSVEVVRQGRREVDSLYFHMPAYPYPVRVQVRTTSADGAGLPLPPGTRGDSIAATLAAAMHLDAALGAAPVVVTIDSGSCVLSARIGVPPNLWFADPEGRGQGDAANLVVPIALLPSAAYAAGVQLSFTVVVQDAAGNLDSLSLGRPLAYTLSAAGSEGVLADRVLNYPNPFASVGGLGVSSGTTIRFVINAEAGVTASVRLRIFDAAGDQVYVADLGDRRAGEHLVTWSGQDIYGRALATGVYFARLEARAAAGSDVGKLRLAILNRP